MLFWKFQIYIHFLVTIFNANTYKLESSYKIIPERYYLILIHLSMNFFLNIAHKFASKRTRYFFENFRFIYLFIYMKEKYIRRVPNNKKIICTCELMVHSFCFRNPHIRHQTQNITFVDIFFVSEKPKRGFSNIRRKTLVIELIVEKLNNSTASRASFKIAT